MRMRIAVSLVGLLVLTGLAPVAKAVPVEVTYSVSTAVNLPLLALNLGTLTGTSTIRYLGTGANTLSGPSGGFVGPARIRTLNAAGPLNFQVLVLGTGTLTGFASVAAGPEVNGALAALGGPLQLPLDGAAGGFIHCTGAVCAHPLLALPVSVNIPISLVFNTVLQDLTAFPTAPGVLTLVGGFGTFGGVSLTATSTLTEISRTAVPEPGTAVLVWLGLVGRAGVRARARRQRMR
jgi:hypothetical protein